MHDVETHKTNTSNFPFLPTLWNFIVFRGQLNTTGWEPSKKKYSRHHLFKLFYFVLFYLNKELKN